MGESTVQKEQGIFSAVQKVHGIFSTVQKVHGLYSAVQKVHGIFSTVQKVHKLRIYGMHSILREIPLTVQYSPGVDRR